MIPKRKIFDLYQILSTNSLRKSMETSLENLYEDIGAQWVDRELQYWWRWKHSVLWKYSGIPFEYLSFQNSWFFFLTKSCFSLIFFGQTLLFYPDFSNPQFFETLIFWTNSVSFQKFTFDFSKSLKIQEPTETCLATCTTVQMSHFWKSHQEATVLLLHNQESFKIL